MEEKRKRTSRDTDRAGTRAGSEQTHRQPGSAQREGAYRYRNPEEEGYYGNGQGQQQYRQGPGRLLSEWTAAGLLSERTAAGLLSE